MGGNEQSIGGGRNDGSEAWEFLTDAGLTGVSTLVTAAGIGVTLYSTVRDDDQ